MGNRFIPDADQAFAARAEAIATTIAKDPEKYTLVEHDVEMLSRAVREFRAALLQTLPQNRNTANTRRRQNARKECEAIVRRLGLVRSVLQRTNQH